MTEEKKDGKMNRSDYWGMYILDCSCGGSMATNGQKLSEAIAGAKSYKCPNHLYGTCNKSYSAAHFKKIAQFIPANIPAGLQ